jgi:hypothetical protein
MERMKWWDQLSQGRLWSQKCYHRRREKRGEEHDSQEEGMGSRRAACPILWEFWERSEWYCYVYVAFLLRPSVDRQFFLWVTNLIDHVLRTWKHLLQIPHGTYELWCSHINDTKSNSQNRCFCLLTVTTTVSSCLTKLDDCNFRALLTEKRAKETHYVTVTHRTVSL